MRKGQKHSASSKKKIAKAVTGENNPSYKDGRRSYRTKVKAKSGDLVHHKDEDRHNNSKSNLIIIKKKDRSKHEKIHKRERNFKK